MTIKREDFLVEIGTEELPPKALRGLELAFAREIENGLNKARLSFGELSSFATPRRLAVLVKDLQTVQESEQVEKKGPPEKVAFDQDGKPTRAAEAFADGFGVAVDTLDFIETPKGRWLVFRGESAGQPAAELLPQIVDQALAALPVPRRMRWGDSDDEFVRPVHWLVMLLGKTVIDTSVLGCGSARFTRGHRFHAPKPIEIKKPSDYEQLLEKKGRVVANFSTRRQRIKEAALAVAGNINGTVVTDEAVLDEVTALVEWPVALSGSFDEGYLRLPPEVLIATLQGHQRYFPVENKDGQLQAAFITISNIESQDPEQVKRGNERVVHPRLSDAAFFLDQDSATRLEDRCGGLSSVVFQRGLGSLQDKSDRIEALAIRLAAELDTDKETVRRAAQLSKADLLTEMVAEFPELQGRMGYYYAKHDGEAEAVAVALEEQYLPRHAGDGLPESATGQSIAIADRVDTLAGIFALGKRPSGNKDPYGLRRSALSLMRILIEKNIDLDFCALVTNALTQLPVDGVDAEALSAEIYDFCVERLRSYYLDGLAPNLAAGTVSTEMFDAVRSRGEISPLDFHQRLLAVQQFLSMEAAESLAVANKRIANILKSADEARFAPVNPEVFAAKEEQALFDSVEKLLDSHRSALRERRYT
ncbi:MAG: glycine--tRNA ligase subunit beta, partial [Gammaproteobacteria bacterium]